MLLSASIGPGYPPLFGLLDRVRDDLGISAEPVRFLDEFAALDLEDLHPAAALVVGRGDLKRWHKAAEGKVMDRLEPVLDLLAGRRLAAIGLQRVAGCLDV